MKLGFAVELLAVHAWPADLCSRRVQSLIHNATEAIIRPAMSCDQSFIA